MNCIVVDIGNTNITIGYAEDEHWIAKWNIANVPERSSNEYTEFFRGLLDIKAVDCIALSSVVPQSTEHVLSSLRSFFTIEPIVIQHSMKHTLRHPVPSELGNDLFANAVAAMSYKSDCIVVDSGTALTFTAITKDGKILGVSILPGIRNALQNLSKTTAQLPLVDLIATGNVFGKTTSTAIQSGIVLGYTGALREITNTMKKEMAEGSLIIGTGGDIDILNTKGDFSYIDKWHTLKGIKQLAEMNCPA